MLQACLNGSRTRDFHHHTPLSASELAADAAAVIAAGANEIHLHPRDANGAESLDPDVVAAAIEAIRARAPGTRIGLSTHEGIAPTAARLDAIERWSALPDYVSVNLVEEGAQDIIRLAQLRGIGVEAGLWSAQDAERFVAMPEARKCTRILIEINEQSEAEGLAVAAAIRKILARASLDIPILQHGFDATMWPLYRDALLRGLETRIGLEDGKALPTGEEAADNTALIKAAMLLARVPPNLPPEATPSIGSK